MWCQECHWVMFCACCSSLLHTSDPFSKLENKQTKNPCGLGVDIQPTPALMCIIRDDNLRDINCSIPLANCMLHFLVYNWVYELGQLALGCPGSGNMLIQVLIQELLTS